MGRKVKIPPDWETQLEDGEPDLRRIKERPRKKRKPLRKFRKLK